MVTDQVHGETRDKMVVPDDEKIDLIGKFVAAVEHLHGLGVSHGDIHHGNVMLGTQSRSLFLIDIPDFSPSGDEPKTTATALNTSIIVLPLNATTMQ